MNCGRCKMEGKKIVKCCVGVTYSVGSVGTRN
jgi:hypothetical protein